MSRVLAGCVGVVALSSATGCRDLDRFDTGDGAAYCGPIVSAAFAREGFPPDLRLRLRLDMDALSSTPGSLTTDDAATSPCTPKPRFDEAPLRATEALFHDPLSTFDFGDGRDHNFFAWVDSSCEGPTMAVVSLMKNDSVEVRLLKPPAPPPTGSTEPTPAGFGLFQLERYDGDCGF